MNKFLKQKRFTLPREKIGEKSEAVCGGDMKYTKLVIIVMLGLILSITASATPIKAQDPPPYYAGYYFYGKEVPYASGVSGKIYTINPEVPGTNYFAQWVTVMLSLRDRYWIQIGYAKDLAHTGLTLLFYIEILDAWGHRWHWISTPKPQEGIVYKYTIVPAYSNNEWKCTIEREGNNIFEALKETNPFDCVDLEAFSETGIGEINIDGTHFSELSYFTGRGFPLWDHHVPHADSPYYLEEIADYEFYAYGGG